MRLTKKFIALALAVIMIFATCVVASAYATLSAKSTANIKGATYTKYSVYGSSSGKTVTANVIKFNTNDGIYPLAYATSAGKVNVLSTHVNAAIADGYEVIGAVNASFFDMTTGDPCSTLISDGKLIFDHADKNDATVTAFDYDGRPVLVGDASLDYNLCLGNNTISTKAIGMVNKDYSASSMSDATISTRFHYYDSDMGNLANSNQKGYEILCEKLNGTDIGVGRSLQGKVLSVTSGYYGKTRVTDANRFVLFVKSSSSYASYATSLSSGDKVILAVTAYDSWANEVLSKANSAIGSTYWLVLDGRDLTDTQSTIIHSTSLSRAWTAFGWDDAGNYHFFVSKENGLTLKDVADAMISMGCVNVVRLDGGGSTTMYVDGYGLVENAGSRSICDSILIVKRSDQEMENVKNSVSATKTNLASGKDYTISVTNDPVVDSEYNNDYSAKLTDGEAAVRFEASDGSWFGFYQGKNVINNVGSVTVDFDNICNINQLRLSVANKIEWGVNPPTSIKAYGSVNGETYTYIGDMPIMPVDGVGYWSELDVNVRAGSIRFDIELGGTWAMLNELEIHGVTTEISYPYAGAMDNLASGREYTISVTNEPMIDEVWGNDYSADLTDGEASFVMDNTDGSWFAFNVDHNVENGIGSVTVDFDVLCDINHVRLNLANKSDWGVKAPKSIKVYGSRNGSDYELLGDMPVETGAEHIYWSALSVTSRVASVRFEFELDGRWAMVNELEIYGEETDISSDHICTPDGDGWRNNQTQHWHECICGAKLDAEEHVPEGKADCENDVICKTCNSVIELHAGHDYQWVITKEAEVGVLGEKEYKCTVCGDVSKTKSIPALKSNVLGDVNKSGAIDMMDYIIIKRNYFGTFKFSADQISRGDCNRSGGIDMMDYILVKRAYFGTYKLV